MTMRKQLNSETKINSLINIHRLSVLMNFEIKDFMLVDSFEVMEIFLSN
jgi:hypothetical protein